MSACTLTRWTVDTSASPHCTPYCPDFGDHRANAALDDYAVTLTAIRHAAALRRRFLDGTPDGWTRLALLGATRDVTARLVAAGVR